MAIALGNDVGQVTIAPELPFTVARRRPTAAPHDCEIRTRAIAPNGFSSDDVKRPT
jgi:hypothetical protein